MQIVLFLVYWIAKYMIKISLVNFLAVLTTANIVKLIVLNQEYISLFFRSSLTLAQYSVLYLYNCNLHRRNFLLIFTTFIIFSRRHKKSIFYNSSLRCRNFFDSISSDNVVWIVEVMMDVEKEVGTVVVGCTLEYLYLVSNSKTSWMRMMMTMTSMMTPIDMMPHRKTGKHLGSRSSWCLYLSPLCEWSDGKMDCCSIMKLTFFLS